MEKFSITRPTDVTTTIRRVMGFEPRESIVIVGIGGGPTARLDVGDVGVIVKAFAPAAPHWQEHGVIAVLYSDVLGEDYLADVLWSLNVPVVATGLVSGDTVTLGGHIEPYVHDGRTREGVTLDVAAAVQSADEADEEAARAYWTGNGALAWAYLDRSKELRGEESEVGKMLSALLIGCVDPHSGVTNQ